MDGSESHRKKMKLNRYANNYVQYVTKYHTVMKANQKQHVERIAYRKLNPI